MLDFLIAFVSTQYNVPSVALIIVIVIVLNNTGNIKNIESKWFNVKLRKSS